MLVVVASGTVDDRDLRRLEHVGGIAMLFSKSQIWDNLFRAAPTGNEARRTRGIREMVTGQTNGLHVFVKADFLLGLDEGDVVVDVVGVPRRVLDDELDVDDLFRAFVVSATVIADHDVEQFRQQLQVYVDAMRRRDDPMVTDDGTAAKVERSVTRLLHSDGHLKGKKDEYYGFCCLCCCFFFSLSL